MLVVIKELMGPIYFHSISFPFWGNYSFKLRSKIYDTFVVRFDCIILLNCQTDSEILVNSNFHFPIQENRKLFDYCQNRKSKMTAE